jgi:hypothetical protein
MPPIVGVPLFDKCHDGPSSYIGCLATFFNTGIMLFVRINVTKKAKTNVING